MRHFSWRNKQFQFPLNELGGSLLWKKSKRNEKLEKCFAILLIIMMSLLSFGWMWTCLFCLTIWNTSKANLRVNSTSPTFANFLISLIQLINGKNTSTFMKRKGFLRRIYRSLFSTNSTRCEVVDVITMWTLIWFVWSLTDGARFMFHELLFGTVSTSVSQAGAVVLA